MKNPLNTLGASNLSLKERSALDYYGTSPKTTKALLGQEPFSVRVWEPCVGHHLIADALDKHGYVVRCSDITEYPGYEHEVLNFLETTETWDGDIVTNPPYNLAADFVKKALETVTYGHKVAMLLRLQFLEGQKRYSEIFEQNPPSRIYVFTNRQVCSKVDDFTEGSAVAYAWFVWEKGFIGSPTIHWLTA